VPAEGQRSMRCGNGYAPVEWLMGFLAVTRRTKGGATPSCHMSSNRLPVAGAHRRSWFTENAAASSRHREAAGLRVGSRAPYRVHKGPESGTVERGRLL